MARRGTDRDGSGPPGNPLGGYVMSVTMMDRAVAAGGSLWERGNRSRVYLNRAEVEALVSDCEARSALAAGKVWVDAAGPHFRPGRGAVARGDLAGALAVLEAALGDVEAAGGEVEAARVESPTPTYRETRMRRAERLRASAEAHAARSDAAEAEASRMAASIPFGQPILVGHHSEGRDRRYRARIVSHTERSLDEYRAAKDAARRADEIEAQARHSIYSDDPDAVERLAGKLAVLEDRRDRVKRYNVSARKALKADPESKHGDLSILTTSASGADPEAARYARAITDGQVFMRPGGVLPSYVSSNLSGQISTTRKRLEQLRRRG